ncbi:MAG: peptide deformylase [Patescibacteria group bacterium]
MAVREIIEIPNPLLTTNTAKVVEFNAETKQIAQDLIDTVLHASDPAGAGLAAPQIGIPLRMCVVRKFKPNPNDPANTDSELSKEIILINPQITSYSNSEDIRWEGCLSIPDTYGKVKRAKQITVKAQDINGEEIKLKASGFFARIIQHEIDHLDGILFTSKTIGSTVTDAELEKILALQSAEEAIQKHIITEG